MLTCSALTKRFGGLTAVDAVQFSVSQGAILGLIGPNGAGKSTLINLITGFERPDAGTVLLNGVDLGRASPARRARAGLARTFQRPRLVANITVSDLLCGAAWIVGTPRWWVRSRAADRAVDAALDDLGIASLRHVQVQALSSPSLRLVQVAMAVVTDSRFILLDEPVAGLSAAEATRVGAMIRKLAASGVGVLLVEHNMGFVRELAETLLVIDRGARIAEGPTASVLADPRVVSAYLGGDDA